MPHEITLTTAEDIIAVTDAVLARAECSNLDFVCEFADISETQAQNALHMAQELNLIEKDLSQICIVVTPFWDDCLYHQEMIIIKRLLCV